MAELRKEWRRPHRVWFLLLSDLRFAIRESRIANCKSRIQIVPLWGSKQFLMKKHRGMRPHDIAVLLKIASKGRQPWYMKDLAFELGISAGEISESLNRSVIAGLISSDKKTLRKLSLLDFLRSGLRYVYPQRPGAMVRGIGTAHSAAPLNGVIVSDEKVVWPYGKGNGRGQAIEPLHPNTPEACLRDEKYYELMALTDALRIGRAREQKMAFEMIRERIDEKPDNQPKGR